MILTVLVVADHEHFVVLNSKVSGLSQNVVPVFSSVVTCEVSEEDL